MTLDRLSQITEVGIKSGITLNGINVIGVVTATSLTVNGGAVVNGVVTATSFSGNVTGNITPTGLVVSGVSTFQASSFWGDGDIAYFGDGQDLLIFHNSTDSIIRDNGTGDLFIEGGNVIRMTNPTGIETYATFNQNAAVELYYDNAKKFETTSGGASITGDLVVSGIITSGTSTITIDGPNNSITVGSAFIKNNSVGLGTTDTTGRNAGVGTAIGTLIYNATENSLQVYTGTRWETGVTYQTYKATGGTVSLLPTNKVIHTFTSSGTFQIIDSNLSGVEVFMVGGGGGGGSGSTGSHYGGGGGAGLLRYATSHPVSSSPGNYPVVVGSGGASPGGTNTHGSKGVNTTFDTLTCEGGGLGRGIGPATGGDGGSGGGAAFPGGSGGTGSGDTGGTDGATSPSSGWGNDGGTYVSGGQGGGGGGAGGETTGPTNTVNGVGLLYAVSGISTTYASGGGGANYYSAFMLGANTGGGGNGGFPGGSNAGQSGIVIIAYPTS